MIRSTGLLTTSSNEAGTAGAGGRSRARELHTKEESPGNGARGLGRLDADDLRVDRLPSEGRLDRGDVDLLHGHHRVEGPFGRCGVRAGGGVEQDAWSDLPGEAPAVLAPTAGAFLAAVVDDRVPVAVGLGLILGNHHEADRFVRGEVGAAVEANELLAEHAELDGQLVAFLAAGEVRRCLVGGADLTVRKDGGVELRRLAGLAVVEPQAGGNRVGSHFRSPSFVDDDDRSAPLSGIASPGGLCGPAERERRVHDQLPRLVSFRNRSWFRPSRAAEFIAAGSYRVDFVGRRREKPTVYLGLFYGQHRER